MVRASIPDEPEGGLGGIVLLGLEFVADEILHVTRLGGSSSLALADFLHGGVRRYDLGKAGTATRR